MRKWFILHYYFPVVVLQIENWYLFFDLNFNLLNVGTFETVRGCHLATTLPSFTYLDIPVHTPRDLQLSGSPENALALCLKLLGLWDLSVYD